MSNTARLAVLALLAAGTGVVLSTPAEARRGRASTRADVVELGRRLFFDPAASRAGKFSCASCHDPEHGFSDARIVSEDENGKTRRHSQPLTDLVDGRGMHWDGEFDTVRELLTARLSSPQFALASLREVRKRHYDRAKERGDKPNDQEFRRTMSRLQPPYYGPATPQRPTFAAMEARVNEDGRYDRGFSRAFGSANATTERVLDALEAYVLSLRTTESAYDRYAAGDPGALTEQQRRGLGLFDGKANCASCHSLKPEGGRALFTDGRYHNTGIAFHNVELSLNRKVEGDGGFGEITFVHKDMGKFKTPSLRDVARRAPYMHDGSLKTLEDVVRYYDQGGTPNKYLDRNVAPLKLTDAEVADLVAFLEALNGDERSGLGDVPAYERRANVRLVDLTGKPMKGFSVEVRPFGDRLRGAERGAKAIHAKTGSTGRLAFDFPRSTHVTLHAPGYEIGRGRPLPDTASGIEYVVVPKDEIVVRVRFAKGQRNLPKTITAYRVKGKKVVAFFKRVRKLSAREAYYVAGRGKDTGVARVRLDCQQRGAQRLFFELDLAGGESTPIVLPQ